MKRTLDSPLLDLQGRAIEVIDQLRQSHALVLGPTSSGKTFVGEILSALIALSGEGTVIYVVPYRAMATQKWQEWHSAYLSACLANVQVYVSSKDHVAYDALISRGDFQILIVVYEKLAALLAQGARILERCNLLIVDEFQMLSHFDRGPRLEFILTSILNANDQRPGSETFILGLSATLSSEANSAIDDWLSHSPLGDRPLMKVESKSRPVELREYVLTPDGICFTRNADGAMSRESLMLPPPMPNLRFPDDLVCSLVGRLAKQSRKILIFRASRQQSSVTAEMLTGILPRKSIDDAVSRRLDELERTPVTEKLATTLVPRGIAFHNASLSFEERKLVEDLFSGPEMPVSVLCSTETLAVGINLPADTVVIADLRKPAGERCCVASPMTRLVAVRLA